MKENKGITLMALVVTVIVLLILSAVSLSALFDQEGVVTKATSAKEEHQIETIRESLNQELTDILSDQILVDKETSREESMKEFAKMGYLTQQVGEGSNAKYYVFDRDVKYAYRIVEYENEDQEVVWDGDAYTVKPKITGISVTPVAIGNDFGVQIVVNSERAENFTYAYKVPAGSETILTKTTDSSIQLNLSEIDRNSQKPEIYGNLEITVNAFNKGTEADVFTNKDINISKIVLDANGGSFTNIGTSYSILMQKGNTLGSISSKIYTPNAGYPCEVFDGWKKNGTSINNETKLSDEKVTLLADWNEDGHNFTEDSREAATCSECGTIYLSCKNNNCHKTKTEEIAKLKHDMKVTKTIAATCTVDEVTTYTCSRCGYTYTEVGQLAFGHNKASKRTYVSGNCQSRSYSYYKCTNSGCNAQLDFEYGDYGAHSSSYVPTNGGMKHSLVCSLCGYVEPGSTSSHSFGPVYTDYLRSNL